MTDKTKLDKYYLQLFLTSPIGQYQIESKTMKSAQPKLALSRIKEIEISLPSLPEQQKISSILSKVDSQIQDNQSYLRKLQELKKGLMQDLLTGKVRVCV
ncbi:MAG: restriction endonuclease subunit S [Methanosarcina barkeri]|nr:restriction endonuclease subunit S [Methanosarcina sp. ERenArc_MAG2]